ncbi:Isoamylase 1 chloroplastic [Zea mays]|uniref:Isoamylase 1 chloroplastic n=1 Tax=Zea mays TaxID=4577 RepID=A0A1D6J3B9_MAIZE|nr:Isoamylase 1 chloroplastic [Zea mays]
MPARALASTATMPVPLHPPPPPPRRNIIANTLAVLEAMAAHNVRTLIYSSTCATYGEPDKMPSLKELPSIILVISQSWMHWKALLKGKQYSNMACSYLAFLFVCVVSCMFYTKSLYAHNLCILTSISAQKSLYASKQTFGIVVHIGFNTTSVVPGVPMFYMGDEYGHTKGENNNTYCHDHYVNYFRWDRKEEQSFDLYRFCCLMTKFRKECESLGLEDFPTSERL